MPYTAFQPCRSLTCTDAIGVPSWRRYCDLGPTNAAQQRMNTGDFEGALRILERSPEPAEAGCVDP